MLAVGLTGGIGTGKSICASIFKALGVPIYESDHEAKRLMVEDEQLRSDLIASFGDETYLPSGDLNRQHLSKIVFHDRTQLKKINGFVHPAVRRDFINWCQSHFNESYIIQESALIYEIGLDKYYDKVIVVDAPKEIRIERVMKRDEVDHASVKARMKNQLPQKEKVAKANYVIHNDGQQSVIRQVLDIHMELLDLSKNFF